MAVLMEISFPGTPEDYDKVDAALDMANNPVDGMIIHTAAQDGDNMKAVDVWESAEAFGAFAQGRLATAISETLGDDGPQPGEPKITELHNVIKQ